MSRLSFFATLFAAVLAVAPAGAQSTIDKSAECSRQADALGLHGRERARFREQCKQQENNVFSVNSDTVPPKPQSSDALNKRPAPYYAVADPSYPIVLRTEANKPKPVSAVELVNRGNAYLAKGDYDHAIADYTEAIRLRPDDAQTYAMRGDFFEKRGELPRALSDFTQSLILQSDLAAAIAGRDRVRAAMAAKTTPPTPASIASPTLQSHNEPVAATSPALSRRVALIVANHAYPEAPLANPPIDASLVKASLEKVGFSVVVKTDLDVDTFEQSIMDFAETTKGADIALFYFAGHGFSVAAGGREQNLLMSISTNFSARTALALQSGGEPLEHVEETLIGHARATLFFIDACRSVPVLASRGVVSRGFAPIDTSSFEGAYVVLSTRNGKTAEDGVSGQGSPFARAFASILPTPGLRIEDAYYRIRETVRAETAGEQVPDAIRSDLPEGGVMFIDATRH